MNNEEVYSNKWATDFAKKFKNLQPKEQIGAVIGDVVDLDPLVISILDGEVIINSSIHDVYTSTNIIGGYGRDFDSNGNIVFSDSKCGTTSSDGRYAHTHTVDTLNINTNYNLTGSITLTDSIVIGDKVLVVADEQDQSFFVVSKLKKV